MGLEPGLKADSKPELTMTPVKIWWICWACVWTVPIGLGFAYLIAHRNTPTLRVRGLGLSLSSVVLLHVYWMSVQFHSTFDAVEPQVSEYWIMGTWLPCGIALFHASNSRFLHVAKQQKKYAQPGNHPIDFRPALRSKNGLIGRFRRLSYTAKVLIVVGISMLVQVFLTALMYIISRKWHSSWGIPGTEVHGTAKEKKIEMGRGWEWWPGVFWQFFWSWIIAPVVLWKSRNIHDTQGWRIQTIGCALANLPAIPLWLIALYVPGMAPVNKYWLPAQWICLSIYFMEIFTVFLPCWEVMRHQSLRRATLDGIAQRESKNKTINSGSRSFISASTMVKNKIFGLKSRKGSDTIKASFDESILTMSALECFLERNPAPLQEFAALREFSGENIAFLTTVAEWKRSLPPAGPDSTIPSDYKVRELIREHFNCGLHIYADFVSLRQAEFPINITSKDRTKLERIFESPTRMLYGDKCEVNPIAPFDTSRFSFGQLSTSVSSEDLEKSIRSSSFDDIKNRAPYWGNIPEEFDATVFDDAIQSIKFLVLTNTWPKFIRTFGISTSSSETLETGMQNEHGPGLSTV
ncbi:hypothetical protein N7474_005556 [Penicillium riverlandense]|uniref:uncharacterized protein n=1 Tax=Penicillium riverlandense TaxID=1903569 RepID=UPI0025467CBB|nr:uncharacterized protein N7474_005556 [Penicillium riverlandense]KAJ5819965.1 hypothetical protein N7474_005556 [Penicillium riverlandense]